MKELEILSSEMENRLELIMTIFGLISFGYLRNLVKNFYKR